MIKHFLRYNRKVSALILLLLVLISCNTKEKVINVYFWKQQFELSANQEALLSDLGSNKIYLKFFDIDVQNGALSPLAKLSINNPLDSIEVVPCVYITNRTFTEETDIPSIALNTKTLIEKILAANNMNPIQEIQFDCDWTASTQESYFSFLEEFQKIAGPSIAVSSTLRLHQLKYPAKTGIPPVQKVCLMCYNLGNIKDANEHNSIFTPTELEKYINNKSSYPLPMDIALPVFSWAVVYRFEKLSLIKSNVVKTDLLINENFEKIGPNLFKAKEDAYFKGSYLYANDKIRFEEIPIDSLKKAIPIIKNVQTKNTELILFDLSSPNILNYTDEDFTAIRNSFY